jgi:hypothetical protein
MKTDNMAPGDVIWNNNEDLLTDEVSTPPFESLSELIRPVL